MITVPRLCATTLTIEMIIHFLFWGQVRRAIVKVVVALAHKGRLKGIEGADFLLFIVNNSIMQPQTPTVS
jgi:hypothetical protein